MDAMIIARRHGRGRCGYSAALRPPEASGAGLLRQRLFELYGLRGTLLGGSPARWRRKGDRHCWLPSYKYDRRPRAGSRIEHIMGG